MQRWARAEWRGAAACYTKRPSPPSSAPDFVYVANVVHANMLASRAPAAQVAGQVFNVGCGRAISVNELWQSIRELVGTDVEPEYVEGRAGEVRDSLAAIEKARELFGYSEVVSFEDGLRQTIAYYGHTVVGRRRTEPRGVARRGPVPQPSQAPAPVTGPPVEHLAPPLQAVRPSRTPPA